MTKRIPVLMLSNDESARPQIVHANIEELINNRPIYQPLVDVLTKGIQPERIYAIPPKLLNIEPEFRADPIMVEVMARHFRTITLQNEEFGHKVLVMRRHDGSLWIYDDCTYVEAAQQMAPDKALICAVWDDPTQ